MSIIGLADQIHYNTKYKSQRIPRPFEEAFFYVNIHVRPRSETTRPGPKKDIEIIKNYSILRLVHYLV